MIPIEQLRYVRLGTRDLRGAIDFAQRILGLELVDKTDEQATFRSDFRDHTLVYVLEDELSHAIAFEVRNPEALDRAGEALQAAGRPWQRGTKTEADRRQVRDFVAFDDHAGNRFELVVRPLQSGWRYFPSRDAGIVGLEAVALRSANPAANEALWTGTFASSVSDWAGDSAYLRFDEAHHRLAYHPSRQNGLLAVEYAVENVDLLMQNHYFLRSAQVRIVDGPGRRPTSGQLFLTFAGHEGRLFSYVAEGTRMPADGAHKPRQFARSRASYCAWNSDTEIPEFDINAERERGDER